MIPNIEVALKWFPLSIITQCGMKVYCGGVCDDKRI